MSTKDEVVLEDQENDEESENLSGLEAVEKGLKDIYDSQKKERVEHGDLFTKAHEAILKKFEKISPISEKEFIDGYFIFYHGEQTVCHFKLAKYPDWKFGIWLRYDEDEEDHNRDAIHVDVFAQLEKFIDKFKPSRSAFSTETHFHKKWINDEKWDSFCTGDFNLEFEDWDLDHFKLIWQKPYLAKYGDIYSHDFNHGYISPLKAYFLVKKTYLKDKIEDNKKRNATKMLTRKLTRWFNKNLKSFGDFEFAIKDSGDCVSPRYHPAPTIAEKAIDDKKIEDFNLRYNDYKDKLLKKFGKQSWVYDEFGWVEWYVFQDDSNEDDETDSETVYYVAKKKKGSK